MITNRRQLPTERFTENALTLIERATQIAWANGASRVGVLHLEEAMTHFYETEVVAESEQRMVPLMVGTNVLGAE